MSTTMLIIIAGMALVTYIPRMLPLVFLNVESIPPWLQATLRNVPYAALGALIFPGIFYIHDNILYGIIGGASAFIIAYLGANLIIVVMSSIGILMLLSFLL
ncbi:AzlD domain-containing protein [Alkalihalobacillus oceani]|uniref:AzlD domain-containing protein n=1 Tax=Halalkalibacter oceani TaxID=1653776 RepID=UPI00204076BE|nr:AzlD domain-containing protein [Halalkalibacter oceani]MCM3759845.1 AzlD domain-containing protein [Halalkalibacter oceani]